MKKNNLLITAGVALGIGATSTLVTALVFRGNKKNVENNKVSVDDKSYKNKKKVAYAAAGVAIGAAAVAAAAGVCYMATGEEIEITDENTDTSWNSENEYLVTSVKSIDELTEEDLNNDSLIEVQGIETF